MLQADVRVQMLKVLKKGTSTQTPTHIHRSVGFLSHWKPHSAKEIFNFPTPVSMLFYLTSFDLQTDQSSALRDTVHKGDWAVCVFCFIGMLASNGTYLVAILHFIFFFELILERCAVCWSSLRPPRMRLNTRPTWGADPESSSKARGQNRSKQRRPDMEIVEN